MAFPYGFELDPEAFVAFLVGAAVAGFVLGAIAVAITAAARR